LRLFSERGVTATTVEDITNAADVGKGTFFNYFPSKEQIIADICRTHMGTIKEFVSRAVRSTQPMDLVLYELAVIKTQEFARSPALVLNILAPTLAAEATRQHMADDLSEDRHVLEELMAARQKRGELRDDYTPLELAHQFQRAFFGTTVLWSLEPSKPLTECLKKMSNVLWSGMRDQTTNRGKELPGTG
jgi:AcrR family transcriptional regulator